MGQYFLFTWSVESHWLPRLRVFSVSLSHAICNVHTCHSHAHTIVLFTSLVSLYIVFSRLSVNHTTSNVPPPQIDTTTCTTLALYVVFCLTQDHCHKLYIIPTCHSYAHTIVLSTSLVLLYIVFSRLAVNHATSNVTPPHDSWIPLLYT